MAQLTAKQITAQWLLAGRLTGALSLAQMLLFVVILLRFSTPYAAAHFWGLILGFSITGVAAAVCLGRVRARRRY